MGKKYKAEIGIGPTAPVSRTNIVGPNDKTLMQRYWDNGYNVNSNMDGSYNLERTTGYDVNPVFKWLNLGAQTLTGFANGVTDARNTLAERARYTAALQPRNWENPDEAGLNPLPIYTQFGGKIPKMPYGGGPLTAEGAKEILRDGTVHGKKLTPKQRKYFGFIAGGGKPKKATGGNAARPIEAEEGEVYSSTDGSLMKVPDGAGTHEEGGVIIHDAARVLEDTSDKRKDEVSQLFKLTPDMAEELTGYKPRSEVTHSKALEKAVAHHDKEVKKFEFKIKNNVDTMKDNLNDKYANNSLKLNLMGLGTIPTSGEIFDNLFKHQENVKVANGLVPPKKYAIGGENPPEYDPITGVWLGDKRTKFNAMTDYSSIAEYAKAVGYTGPIKLGSQAAIRDTSRAIQQFVMANYPDIVAKHHGPGSKYGMPTAGKPDDGMLGVRWSDIARDIQRPVLRNNLLPDDPSTYPQVPDISIPPEAKAQPRTPFNLRPPQPRSRFNEPLRWFDVAGPVSGLISSTDRIPAQYDAPEFNQVRLHQQNPLPALQNAQGDYNAALELLPQDGVGYANAANIFAKKYGIDNQTLGQYANANNQIANQETGYNAQVRDRQSLADVQARGTFEQKYLLSKEAQRQQKLTSLDELYTRIAQNRKLNREGNLLMQLYPAFDQFGEYNGYNLPLRAPLSIPNVATNS